MSDPPLAKALASLEKRASPVQGARFLPAGRALMGTGRAPRARPRCAPDARACPARSRCPAINRSRTARSCSPAIAEGTSSISGLSGERGLSGEPCGHARAGRAASSSRSRREVRVHGVGLHGLKAAAHALDMGNAGTAIRLFTGLLAAQAFDSQLIGDASLMRRPMERVAQAAARDGCGGAHPRWHCRRSRSAAGAGCTASTTACRSRAPR